MSQVVNPHKKIAAAGLHSARAKLVLAALRLFAEKGFEATSTREICEAAQANISAIRYYFGDKAGLYRAAFCEPLAEKPCAIELKIDPSMPMREVFHTFFTEFLGPLKQGEVVRLVMKLRFREMIEPTGAWANELEGDIKPQHNALVKLLTQRLGLKKTDTDVQRLALAIMGMAVNLFVSIDIIGALAPSVLATPKSIDLYAVRLAGFASAMVDEELRRRAGGAV